MSCACKGKTMFARDTIRFSSTTGRQEPPLTAQKAAVKERLLTHTPGETCPQTRHPGGEGLGAEDCQAPAHPSREPVARHALFRTDPVRLTEVVRKVIG